jgi:hypothetical protein
MRDLNVTLPVVARGELAGLAGLWKAAAFGVAR